MRILNKKKKLGFTLVEILLVVGFIALAGIGIYTIYSKVKSSNTALMAGKNLDTLRAGIKSLYGGQQRYTTISNTIVNDARITPDSMRAVPYVAGDAIITNEFGHNVLIFPEGIFAPDNAFRIIYEQVPRDVCAKLVMGTAPSWDQIIVGQANTVVKVFGTSNVDIALLASACTGGGQPGVDIGFSSL